MSNLSKDSIDPFTQIYDAVLLELKNSPEIVSLVKLPNFISYQDKEKPKLLQNRLSADTPELELFHSNGTAFLHKTSQSAQVNHSLALFVNTDDLRAQNKYNPIKWFAMLALGKFVEQDLKLDFVSKAELSNYQDALTEPDGSPEKITGWKGLLTVEVEFYFDRSLFS